MKDELGLNMVVNPELAAATEIYRLISFPFAINIGTFSNGKVSLIGIYKYRRIIHWWAKPYRKRRKNFLLIFLSVR